MTTKALARQLTNLAGRLDAISARTRLDRDLHAYLLHRLEVDADTYRTELFDQSDWLSRHTDTLAVILATQSSILDRLDTLEGAARPLCAPQSDATAVGAHVEPGNGTDEYTLGQITLTPCWKWRRPVGDKWVTCGWADTAEAALHEAMKPRAAA